MMSPMYSSGVTTSTFIIGSSNCGPAFCHTFFEGGLRSNFERQNGGVHIVVRTVINEGNFEIHHREARDNAGFFGLLQALFNARDVFFRNRTTNDLAFELKA
jgi:hypothetical protein